MINGCGGGGGGSSTPANESSSLETLGYTNDNGSFNIQQIPVGSYQIRLVHQGYETYEYTDAIAIPPGDAYILETATLLSFQGGTVEGQVIAQATGTCSASGSKTDTETRSTTLLNTSMSLKTAIQQKENNYL
ncbi:MAG: carboxypeptidase-like regulatory domain-containing protein [bacterium]|nr:carboxypeptidase-like regulatory domain-containing protein [bacterium]